MNLRYNLMGANLFANEQRHPQVVLKELGINYKKAIPDTMADSWWLIDCTNIPNKLPTYITIVEKIPFN